MILTVLSALLVTSEPATFSEDPADHSVWMQHACRVQQVDRSGGVPEDHDAFCSCLDGYLQENATPQIYRLLRARLPGGHPGPLDAAGLGGGARHICGRGGGASRGGAGLA